MKPNQSLPGSRTGVLEATSRWLATAGAGAARGAGGYHHGVRRVARGVLRANGRWRTSKAGLRRLRLANPFPEEANRRLTAVLADLHFAPTPLARRRLVAEGVPRARDRGDRQHDRRQPPRPARRAGVGRRAGCPGPVARGDVAPARIVGAAISSRCAWRSRSRHALPDLSVVYPVHLNPNVRDTVMRCLSGVDRVRLVPPMDYVTSWPSCGGPTSSSPIPAACKEEAPSLGKPLLVLSHRHRASGGLPRGLARLIGTDRAAIVAACELASDATPTPIAR